MRRVLFNTFALCIALCFFNNLDAQNPNWVMPGGHLLPGPDIYDPLPQNPAWPPGITPGDYTTFVAFDDWKYDGFRSTHSSTGYTGPDGELLCFAIDGGLYDKNGWLVNFFKHAPSYFFSERVKGIDQSIIVPLGTSCSRFAVIFPSSPFNQYNQTQIMDVYYGIYDLTLANTMNPFASGAMVGQGTEGQGATLTSLSQYHPLNHPTGNMRLAVTPLIDNCYRYLWVMDGVNLIRYIIDEDGIQYDNYNFLIPQVGADVLEHNRSEMEIIQLANGNFRFAISVSSQIFSPGQAIKILDLNSSMEVVPSSIQTVALIQTGTSSAARIHGLEFDQSGRFVYFTHAQNTTWPNPLDIWDVQTSSIVTPTIPQNMNSFRPSFIERSGNTLYLANSTHIGSISNISSPASLSFTPNLVQIATAQDPYGNDAQFQGNFRYMLPTQVDDDDSYGDFENFSCECCERWLSNAVSKYEATSNATWSPGASNNPFGAEVGDVVIIKEELRIKEGVLVTINDMEFRFMPEAEVVIEQADNGPNGGELRMNRTTFTANFDCAAKSDDFCEDCDEKQWKGVRVMGISTQPQYIFGSTVQGRLVMRENSMIEHAEIGVRLGSTLAGTGGGIINASNSTFKDNRVGIYFDSYVRTAPSMGEVDNVSRIELNYFTTTDDYLWSASILRRYIQVVNSSGVITRGNMFDYAKTEGTNITKGILANGARLRVTYHCGSPDPSGGCDPLTITRSEFHNLYDGVEVFNGVSATRKVQVEYALFEENTFGVRLNGTINAEILDNEFNLINNASSRGVSLTSSTGYAVENNNFTSTGQLPTDNIGVLVISSGGAYNEIYRNTFTNLSTGIQTQGVNADQGLNMNHPGLEMYCNTFDAPLLYDDIYVRTGNISDKQGHCNDQLGPRAGNLFSHSHINFSPQHFDFRIDPGAFANLEVKYNHHDPQDPRLEPLVYTFIPGGIQLNPVNCQTQFDRGSCPVKKSGSPNGSIGKSGEELAESALSFADLQSLAIAHDDSVAMHESDVDGGNTISILQMIEEGSAEADILEIINEIDGPLSTTLITGLEGTGIDLPVSSDLASAAQSAGSDAADVFSDAEAAWYGARKARTLFWRSVVDLYQTDTLGTFTAEELYAFISNHEPEGIERFASSLAYQLDMAFPSWVSSADQIDVTVDLPVSASEGDSLPQNLEHLFEGDFFDSFSNSLMLSQLYIDHDQQFEVYALPHTFPDADVDADPKSAGGIPEVEEDQAVNAYPNPFNDQIVFAFRDDFKTAAQVRITFHDITGRVIQQQQVPLEVKFFTMDGGALPQGMLFYSIEVDGKHLQTGKLVHLK